MRDKLIKLIGEFCSGWSVTDITPPYGYENLADYLLTHGVTVQEWVSVEDALPEEDEVVLVVNEDDCGLFRFRSINKDLYWVDSEDNLFDMLTGDYWMPLPAPPKEE